MDPMTDTLWQYAMQAGLAFIGLVLVLWLVRVLIPRMEERHEREVTRLLTEAERARQTHLDTVERVVAAHERGTNRIIQRLDEMAQRCGAHAGHAHTTIHDED